MRPCPKCAFAPFAPPRGQAFLAIQTLGLLAVDRDAIRPQQDVQPATVEPAALMRQIAQPLSKHAIIIATRLVADRAPVRCNDPARPPLAAIMKGLKMREVGRIVSRAVIIAVAANEDGKRDVLGVATGPSEAETFRTDVLRRVADRGLSGVKQEIADDHKGLRADARPRVQRHASKMPPRCPPWPPDAPRPLQRLAPVHHALGHDRPTRA